MPQSMPSVRWNAADEESANRGSNTYVQPRSKSNKSVGIQRRGSQRSIDPAAAIPIEYRSLSVPTIL